MRIGDNPLANLPKSPDGRAAYVEIAPECSHLLVAAPVHEVCAVHLIPVAKEHVVTVKFIDAEVPVEAIGEEGIPGNFQPIRAFSPAMSACDAGEA